MFEEIKAQAQLHIEKVEENKGFLRGVVFAVAEMMRGHNDTVVGRDVLDTLGGELHDACRESSEYDVRPLRKIFSDLPFGNDAEYDNLRIVPVDSDGKECAEIDAFEFEVRGDYVQEAFVVSCFDEHEAAMSFIRDNTPD
ncbi:hypothetical protein IAH82_002960 [Escherichia coli]|nr:hypothetical protein [Escherichia coli]